MILVSAGVVIAALILAGLVLGGLAAVQLVRLQAAVLAHREAEPSFARDVALWKAAGFDPTPTGFLRGKRFDVCADCGQPRLSHGRGAAFVSGVFDVVGDECPDAPGQEPRIPPRRFRKGGA